MTSRLLSLADGWRWAIAAENPAAELLVARLGKIMQLPEASAPPPAGLWRQLSLVADGRPQALKASLPLALQAARHGEPASCALETEGADDDLLFAQVMQLTTLFGADAQPRGGALAHGALALIPGVSGEGILLAAPGGAGKTTASSRLPLPWVSLCDDTTLIVRDAEGTYWAHPWPTWSRFLWGGPGGSWDTPRAVRLRAIFFLEQAPRDQAEQLGAGHTAAALVQSIEQASRLMTRLADHALARVLRLEWLDVACALAQRVPGFRLRITLTGAFWEEIQRSLSRNQHSNLSGPRDLTGLETSSQVS